MNRLGAVMDDNARDLMDQLCTRIGMIMEDASELALTIGGTNETDRAEQLTQLAEASACISALVGAAMALEA